jgi:hypothetical protein
MSSIKEHVSFAGVIRGQGHEANCTVTALKVTMRETNIHAYARYEVKAVSGPLPEGDYELTVNGQSFPVRHRGEYWLAAA